MGAPWYAVYVQTPGESMEKIDAATQREIHNNLDLSTAIGGRPFQEGDESGENHRHFCARYGITHIILGRSRQPWYRRWFGRSLLDRLLQSVPSVDVIVIDVRSSAER